MIFDLVIVFMIYIYMAIKVMKIGFIEGFFFIIGLKKTKYPNIVPMCSPAIVL